ncbi:LacI family DNA-binding transcriptional regulator [Pseudonocardia sp. ICBG1293]|uniref:LacI family DNA-binding transcriptional regulator n=1 Tax=Pseudonocardia sp. ICBG1293 TaxID=2844382 RepID=UPI001CC946CC|nr:LacI family DNA-binding transcriptional regulator [Pseudonocardia sp. ICBG1293]
MSRQSPGGGRPRLADVAAQVGLSPASVSLVLRGAPGPSPATRARVLAAAEALGYRPDRAASMLASRRSGTVGVVLDIRSTYHAELVEELLALAGRHGRDLLLGARSPVRDERRAVESLVDSRCEALVLLGSDAPADRLAELGATLPVVAVGRRLPGAGVDVVRVPDDDGAAEQTRHLLGLGHRDVVHVDGGAGSIAAERRDGYRAAMRAAGLPERVVAGGHGEADGARAARTLLAGTSLPTAVAVFNDRCAVGLLDTLARAGVDVPATVSVAGYDDSPLSRLAHVDLTTISQDVPGTAEHVLDLLAEQLDGGRGTAREVVLAPRLIARGSTARPRS